MAAARGASNISARWIRPPVVAGMFYPATAAAVRAELAHFSETVEPTDRPARNALGAVCPHAGWRYAGALAYRTLAGSLAAGVPGGGAGCTVVILAVNHRHRNPPAWSIWPEGAWQTPLGEVPVDAVLAAALMQAAPDLTASALPHEQDHATEVLLPMLQVLLPADGSGAGGVRIVPIVPFLPVREEGAVVEVGRRIGRVLAGWAEPVLVVASNDMTHFAPADLAETQDRKAIARMELLDAPGLLTTARRERITMCGAQPVAAMLAAVREMGATQGRLVGYTHSGVVSGDLHDVVAYAGMVMG